MIKTVIQELNAHKDKEPKDDTTTKPSKTTEEGPLHSDAGSPNFPDLNASTASIEEFIPEIPEQHLNCNVLTNQLQ